MSYTRKKAKINDLPVKTTRANKPTLLSSLVVCRICDLILDTPGTPEALPWPPPPGPAFGFAFLLYGACLCFLFPPSDEEAFSGRVDIFARPGFRCYLDLWILIERSLYSSGNGLSVVEELST